MKTMHRFLIVIAMLLVGSLAQAQVVGDKDEPLTNPPAPSLPQTKPQPEPDTTVADTLAVPDSLVSVPKVMRLLVRTYGDSIVLRWATEDAGLWITAKDYGWMIYRSAASDNDSTFSVNRYGDTIPYRTLNGGKPLKPLTLDEMMQRFDSTDFYAGVAAQALYGQFQYNVNEQGQNANADFMTMAAKQYQEQTQRHFMAMLAAECSPRVAEAVALRFVDRDVVPGEYYEYIVEAAIPPQLAEIEDASVVVYNKYYQRGEEEKMPEVEVTQIDANRAAVRWTKNRLSGYWLDRKDNIDSNWVTVNPNAPIWPMLPDSSTRVIYGDSIAQWMEHEVLFFDSLDLRRTYTYRVRAFDAFGDKVEPREAKPFKLVDFTPPAPPYVGEIIPIDNRICPIHWLKPELEDDLKGYMVMFSTTLEGPWHNVSGLLPRDATSYTDSNAYARGRGYYRVFVADTAGNVNFSPSMNNNIEDITPPEPPIGLGAVPDDSTGLILLFWAPNIDPDLMAYKVYFANQRDHEFIELTPGYIQDTFYFDSVDINLLARDIFYYVIAVDNNHNYSKPSDTLRVLLPDLLPPGVCVLDGVTQDKDTITITWRASVSEDVAKYYVYRKPRPAANWECIAVITPDKVDKKGIIRFGDRPEASIHPWSYCIEAIDSATNSSGMAGFAVAQVDPDPSVKMGITLKANYKKGKTTLTWKIDEQPRKDYYGVVYRKDGNGDFHDVGTFSRKDEKFEDIGAPADTKCSYYIQLQLGRGRHSSPSNTVTVKTK